MTSQTHGMFGELGSIHLIFGLWIRIHFAEPVDRLRPCRCLRRKSDPKWIRKHYTNATLPERRFQNECCSEKQVLLQAY